jgi:hypothetical protein
VPSKEGSRTCIRLTTCFTPCLTPSSSTLEAMPLTHCVRVVSSFKLERPITFRGVGLSVRHRGVSIRARPQNSIYMVAAVVLREIGPPSLLKVEEFEKPNRQPKEVGIYTDGLSIQRISRGGSQTRHVQGSGACDVGLKLRNFRRDVLFLCNP